jgi:hypothetical protein
LEEPARPEHPEHLGEHALRLGDVHEAHERHRKVEVLSLEGQVHGARELVPDTERPFLLGLSGLADEVPGDVDGGHAGALLRDKPGVVPLPAADIEARETVHVGEHFEESRGVQAVAVVVVPGAHQLRLHLGILVPVVADLFVVHAPLPSGDRVEIFHAPWFIVPLVFGA